ncbi:MAG: cytochrome c biogenesis protein CcdA [Chloroflexi bacterium]|nr:cytochrome c biogenesis protein CcdA [Chloroflexota bacterium]
MSVLIAFAAGLLSFLSPCVLPMVPIYIGYLSGAAVTPEGIVSARREAIAHAGAFVLGFTLIFIAIFSALSVLTVFVSKVDLGHIAGAILIVFGIHFIGIVRIPFLYQEARVHVGQRSLGYPTSLLTGMAFAAGWTPCVGPNLGLAISLAGQEATMLQGTGLLLAYSAGLGIPFLLVAFGLGSARQWLRKLTPHLRKIEIASGILLVVMGALLLLDKFQWLNAVFYNLTPEWMKSLL